MRYTCRSERYSSWHPSRLNWEALMNVWSMNCGAPSSRRLLLIEERSRMANRKLALIREKGARHGQR